MTTTEQGPPPADATHGIIDQLLPLALPLDALSPDPVNARKHDKRNLEAILLSYRDHGQRKPIVVQRRPDGELIIRAGNGQAEAAERLGWTHIAAVVVDETDSDAVAFAIRDNRTGELASWDIEALSQQFAFLSDAGTALADLGWEPYEYEPLLVAEWQPPAVDDGADFTVPDKRVSLHFERGQWDELKELLAAKPTAELVLEALRGQV